MNGQGPGVLQQMLNSLEATLGAGQQNLESLLMGYLVFFTGLALVWFVYGLIFNGHQLSAAFALLVRLVIIAWALHHWAWFLEGIRDIAITVGTVATGSRVAESTWLDPGSLVKKGIDSGFPLLQAVWNNLGWRTFWVGGIYLLAYLGYLTAFMIMGWKVLWFQIDLMLAALGGLCVLPALAFRPTAFVAQGVLSYAANMFLRWLIATILVGALWGHLDTLVDVAKPLGAVSVAGIDAKIQEAFAAAFLALALAACFLGVNRLAGVLASGVPGMAGGQSMGGLLRGMAVAGAALLTGGAAAAGGALGVGRAGAAGVQGLLGAGQAGWQAANGGGTLRLGEAARQMYAGARQGMQGGAQAALGRYMGVTGSVAQWSSRQALQQYMRSGTHDVTHQGVRR